MFERRVQGGFGFPALILFGASALVSCGGGSTGNDQDSGTNKTYLSVQASDADGDALQYEWRVTGGTIENRNAAQTVWTMPDGPGLHFAYVSISDGKGGNVEQQYAVSSDLLGTVIAPRAVISRAAPAPATLRWSAGRLRFSAPATPPLLFTPPGGGTAVERQVDLPDVQVQLVQGANVVFSGITDLSGLLALPQLDPGTYVIKCSTVPGGPIADCSTTTPQITVNADGIVGEVLVRPTLSAARNLRLFGHVDLADGSICGVQSEFFGRQTAATVQVTQTDGTALAAPTRVNRFGDYAIDAAVLAKGSYKLKVACEGYSRSLDIPPSPNALGYVAGSAVELSHRMANSRPAVAKMVANGPEGNVRGEMVFAEPGVSSQFPGPLQFLTYKGHDTRLSACTYYQSLGAVESCDAQGNMKGAITLDDWLRQKKLAPYDAGNKQVSAVYINRMDLNLVRRMYATQSAADEVAFYVCNHPGPDGSTQGEVDTVIQTGLNGDKEVACVAMEWSKSPGVNGGKPFTKFLTFGPDGALIPSINLDFRGEKYMPGACVACHGGTQYNGRFPERGSPSPFLGAGFLPFDTGNFLFHSRSELSEASQSQSIRDLNLLVRVTDQFSPYKSTTALIDGWYAGGSTMLDKQYLPQAWRDAEATKPGVSKLYREVVGRTCRTCHVAMGSLRFDWDANVGVVTTPVGVAHNHFCGGTADLAINASMPNALISRDRVADRVGTDATLATIVQTYLGCTNPVPDPAYAKR